MMKRSLTIVLVSTLAGCGGGASNPTSDPDTQPNVGNQNQGNEPVVPVAPQVLGEYRTLGNKDMDAVSEILTTGVLVAGSAPVSIDTKLYHEFDIVEVKYNGNTYQARDFPGGYATGTRPDGRRLVIDVNSSLFDKEIDIFTDPNEIEVEGYDYASIRLLEFVTPGTTVGGQTFNFGSTSTFIPVAMGIATDVRDIPTSGSAAYTGDARIQTSSYGQSFGTARVTANFDNSTISVVLTDDKPLSDIEIRANNLTIDGSTFSGGDVSAWNGNTELFPGLGGTATGGLFGIDEDSVAPDEVSGVIRSNVGAGSFQAEFIAD